MSLLKSLQDASSLGNVDDDIFSMTTKAEICKLIKNVMVRLFPASNNSETMAINDCEILINELSKSSGYE